MNESVSYLIMMAFFMSLALFTLSAIGTFLVSYFEDFNQFRSDIDDKRSDCPFIRSKPLR